MTRQEIIENTRKQIDKVSKNCRAVHHLPEMLFTLAEKVYVDDKGKVSFRTESYTVALSMLSIVRKHTGQPIELAGHFGSYGSKGEALLFYWRGEGISVDFVCPLDEIPNALKPSEDCEVKEVENTYKTLKIVCPAKGGSNG